MGWFSRKDSSQKSKTKKRVTTSNETEIKELKVRARRRLVGAIVLILFAVIVVPMLFDDAQDVIEQTPIVSLAPIPQTAKPQIDNTQLQPDISDNEVQLPENTQEAIEILQAKTKSEQDDTSVAVDTLDEIVKQETSKPEGTSQTVDKPQPKPSKPKEIERSDDGSEALALLQGHTPESSTNSQNKTSGSFILQIAAYSTEMDANTRRDKLIESGISNTYVEQAVSNGKTTYRLRVGSFKTRQAAQAAQTRIRALGYDNSLLISQ